jgi:type IV pilus assembly protein PilC
MPTFVYRARDTAGRLIEGTLEAESERAVVAQIRERGYMPTTLRQQIEAPSVAAQVRGMSGVPMEDLVLFTRQLATMVSAGLPLVSSLEVTAQQTDSRRLREVLETVRRGIEAGATLSAEMGRHRMVFSDLYVNAVNAGEVSGALDRVLVYLADFLEREHDLIQRIKTTATYPAVVFVTAVIVGFVAVFVILPTIVTLFTELKVALPWPTRVLIAVSTEAHRYWYVAVGTPIALVVAFGALSRSVGGRKILDRIFIRLPVVGRLIQRASFARFARLFAMVIRSGIPLVQGMEVVARSTGNSVVGAAVMAASRAVREGQSIADALSQIPLFPPMVWRMINVGEQTGALEAVLDKIGDFYDREVDNYVRRFASLLEPVMIIGVGGVVAFIAVAMLLPLWRLIGALH